ncbi:MAG: hypothetical protein Q7S39_03755 [Ignavibacteria bacterium]|nr:hypothetical protein [Ignavibacteria bacterium]
MIKVKQLMFWYLFILLALISTLMFSQQSSETHSRGKLWETIYNYGFIGDPGAWDYLQLTGIGFYPGFSGYTFPNDEELANGFITDANFHNFRSGPWIIAKDAFTLVPPAFTPERKDFLLYHSSLATGDIGALVGNITPFSRTENFSENPGFNPLLPEEMNYVQFETSTGITVKQRSMQWSYPGYDDFIIYDYVFVNTGDIAIESIGEVRNYQQTLNEVWFVFHSGIQVSTKGVVNFHYNDDFLSSSAPAGSFGWHPGSGYSDYFNVEDKIPGDGKGLLYYSRDYNGGREPVPWDQYGLKSNWQAQLTQVPGFPPELQDPSAFGFVYLYRTPPQGGSGDWFDADPTFFNIYSDELEKFQNKNVDFEGFGTNAFSLSQIYDFATHNHEPPQSSNGRLYCWYTGSFGPYTLAPGDSVQLVIAEVAGTLDLNEVIHGDPNHYLKSFTEDYQNDSLAVDIRRNVEAVRNVVRWGVGANVNGINLAADVPDSPPAPECSATNASAGSDTAIIAVRWNKIAEEVQFMDGSGNIFYDGAIDLSGYRIFRGTDQRGIWDLIVDIPRTDFNQLWNAEIERYECFDKTVQFGFEYSYYVQAYYSNPAQWVSANLTVVNDLGELASGDHNRTPLTNAKPGPVDIAGGFDVFVAPNPYIEGDPNHSFGGIGGDLQYKIEFRNLPEKAKINIYSISGDLIAVILHGPDQQGNLSGSKEWYQRSDSGLLIAPGLYIYVVESETEGSAGSTTYGKLMIIR